MIELLNCPHCNGEAAFKTIRTSGNEYSCGATYRCAECTKCGARTKDYRKKGFNEMSQYTVQDFRENNSLRPEVEEIHRKYKEQLKVEIAAAWNKRIEL